MFGPTLLGPSHIEVEEKKLHKLCPSQI